MVVKVPPCASAPCEFTFNLFLFVMSAPSQCTSIPNWKLLSLLLLILFRNDTTAERRMEREQGRGGKLEPEERN
ncbi:hypothetical protein LOAG_02978 [Loa loa]|uniref:Uncharacterized protein n=1 Tax=Loa loa TaxID=7209 RepID=A0A1S0U583_LOALO|nr:hypothetical protein LOAG_02978 [Loa loa]EFO25503.1 hypothetical protein LOAG_02978 [Loa loa]